MKLISIKVLVNSLMCHRKLFFLVAKHQIKKMLNEKEKIFIQSDVSFQRVIQG